MAKWDNINGIIENAIKSNNAQSITGDSLQSVLKSIVSDVGANATFAGIAIASTSPGSYDGPAFYIAASAGTYAGFGSIVVNAGELAVLYNSANGNGWSKSSIGLSSIVDKSITKAKLASDVPIDAMQNKITQLETSVNTVVGEGATEAIENFAEILAFLNGITDTTTLEGLLTNLKTEIDGKLSNKVDKVSGKGLSTNDYTTAEKDKLNGIESGAQKNTVTGIKGNAETTYRAGNVNITPENIGAAAASHEHSANDITSGTLDVARIADGSITSDKLSSGISIPFSLLNGYVLGAISFNNAAGTAPVYEEPSEPVPYGIACIIVAFIPMTSTGRSYSYLKIGNNTYSTSCYSYSKGFTVINIKFLLRPANSMEWTEIGKND